MPISGSPHRTKPNSVFEAQAAATTPGMFHFALPGGPACGTCTFFGPRNGASATKRHRCRKAWATGVKVKRGFFGSQVGCKYHSALADHLNRDNEGNDEC